MRQHSVPSFLPDVRQKLSEARLETQREEPSVVTWRLWLVKMGHVFASSLPMDHCTAWTGLLFLGAEKESSDLSSAAQMRSQERLEVTKATLQSSLRGGAAVLYLPSATR